MAKLKRRHNFERRKRSLMEKEKPPLNGPRGLVYAQTIFEGVSEVGEEGHGEEQEAGT